MSSNGLTFKVERVAAAAARWERIRALSKRLRNDRSVARAGVLAPLAKEKGDREGSATNIEVAVWNEFGTVRHLPAGVEGPATVLTPSRSFVRAPFSANRGTYLAGLKELLPKVLEGKMPVERALGIVGLKMATDMKKAIREGIPPPNAPSTVAAKHSSTPLEDSGSLWRSITYAVVVPGYTGSGMSADSPVLGSATDVSEV